MLYNRIKLRFKGFSEIVGTDDMALLILTDEAEERQLVIPCDADTLKQMKMRMFKQSSEECLPEAMWSFFSQLTYIQTEICINGFHDGVFFTTLEDTLTGKCARIRCSDAILLASISNLPIYVSRELMLSQSVPFEPGQNKVALPINIISEAMLEQSMQKAIDTEDYETAINLRDELNRRKQLKQNSKTDHID